ncbi:MAG: hypothetical protein IPM29_28110 [Planctomycetes bacterium]|nr:hypothetical protein [Planctomycetota bacterium]
MNPLRDFLVPLAATLGIAGLTAQTHATALADHPAPSEPPATPEGLATAGFDWRVPLHTMESDPLGGEYGLWAGGPDYKASFHDGFEFVPVLGPDAPRNLPVRWRTASVRAGAAELWDPATVEGAADSDWRYVYRSGAVAEVYDLRADGVEQSFVVRGPLDPSGDLVVRGSLLTELEADIVHGAVGFALRDTEGRAVVHYGRAVAIDAAGRTGDVVTRVDAGGVVELRVDAGWLDGAAWPVTIDPLIGNMVVSPTSYAPPQGPDLVRNDVSNEIWLQLSRDISATDRDAFGLILDDGFRFRRYGFTDITTSWSSWEGRVTFVGGANRWALAILRDFPSTSTTKVRVYLHDSGSAIAQNSGDLAYLTAPTGNHSSPSIGGVPAYSIGDRVAVALVTDGNADLDVYTVGVMIDTARVLTPDRPLRYPGEPVTQDDIRPSISRFADPANGIRWRLVWQAWVPGVDRWMLGVANVFSDGSSGNYFLNHAGMPTDEHVLYPHCANFGGRTGVLWTSTPALGFRYNGPYGSRVQFATFSHTGRYDQPVLESRRVLLSSSASRLTTRSFGGRCLDVDDDTRTHFVGTFYDGSRPVMQVFKMGGDGAPLESHVLSCGSFPGGQGTVCFDDDHPGFVIAWSDTSNAQNTVRMARIDPRAASFGSYASGCRGVVRGGHGPTLVNRPPYKGSTDYHVALQSGVAGALAVVILGANTATIPLPGAASSCVLRLAPEIVEGLGIADATGGVIGRLPIPSAVGDFDTRVQFVQLDPLGALTASDAALLRIR